MNELKKQNIQSVLAPISLKHGAELRKRRRRIRINERTVYLRHLEHHLDHVSKMFPHFAAICSRG